MSEHTTGRAVPPLESHTFDSGITAQIRKVSPTLMQDVRKAFPPPRPPMATVDYGAGPVQEENPAHPDHVRAMEAYDRELQRRVNRLYLKRGLVVEFDQGAVDSLRRDLEDAGITRDQQEPDDWYLYVTGVVFGTAEDYQDAVTLITRRSQPTEAAIQEHL